MHTRTLSRTSPGTQGPSSPLTDRGHGAPQCHVPRAPHAVHPWMWSLQVCTCVCKCRVQGEPCQCSSGWHCRYGRARTRLTVTHLLCHLHTSSSGLALRCPGMGPRPGATPGWGQLPRALRACIPSTAPVLSRQGHGKPPRPPPGSALAAPEPGVRGLVPTEGPDPEGRPTPAAASRLTGWHFPSCLLFLLPDRSTSTAVFLTDGNIRPQVPGQSWL